MERVRVTRELAADREAVEALVRDVEPFMLAGGFDAVRVDGDIVELENRVGLFDIELELELVEDADAVLAYEQRQGIFESMATTYDVEETADGVRVVAETTHRSVDLPVLGEVIDAAVVDRQRRKEIEAQFDWLESQLDG